MFSLGTSTLRRCSADTRTAQDPLLKYWECDVSEQIARVCRNNDPTPEDSGLVQALIPAWRLSKVNLSPGDKPRTRLEVRISVIKISPSVQIAIAVPGAGRWLRHW
jgi:hypothetical protein